MPEFKTLNNQLGETVYKELEKHIRKGSKVSTISAYFTMYAYSALKKELDKIDEMRFIFTTPSFSKNKDKEAREYEIVNNNIFGNEFELKLRNEMTQSAVAKDCAKWLKDKVEIKSFKEPNVAQPRMIHVHNKSEEDIVINGSVDFTTDGLGITGSNRADFNNFMAGEEFTDSQLLSFDTLWSNEMVLTDVKDKLLKQMEVMYEENSGEFIYFKSLYHIFYNYLDELDEDNRIYWGNGNIIPRLKKFLNEPAPVTPSSVMMSMFTQTEAINSLKELNLNFDNPKPINLIKWFLEMIDDDEFIVLDFFSGSATTAHATIQLNSEDDGNRKFIMVQLPEIININSKAYKSGYKNICEIGKERIRRAGDKILEKSDNKDLDIGFKVFKLDSSNLEKWDPDYDNLEQTLLTNKENIKPDRTELDLIYEIMLKYGIDLTLPIEKINSIYSIGYGALLICLEDDITKEIAKEIIKLKSDNITRVVFKESGFKSDADKTNIKENLRINNINEFITI